MRRRARRKDRFRPRTSELEKIQGASALVFGSLAGALSPIDQPAFVDLAMARFGSAGAARQIASGSIYHAQLAVDSSDAAGSQDADSLQKKPSESQP